MSTDTNNNFKHRVNNNNNGRSKHHHQHFLKRNKRLRKETKCAVPWKDEWELEQVGRALLTVLDTNNFSGTEDNNNNMMSFDQAMEMISVWQARCDGTGLPHAIESTAALAQTYYRDNNNHNNMASSTVSSSSARSFRILISSTELRLSYSTSIIRCINGFADTLQQQRAVAAPVSYLCGQLGIPIWLVDVRHEASHNALPTLSVLRLACTTMLEFLKNEYWVPTCRNWFAEIILSSSSSSDLNSDLPLGQGNGGEDATAAQATIITTTTTKAPIEYLVEYKKITNILSVWEQLPSTTSTESSSSAATAATTTKKGTPPKKKSNELLDMFFGDDDESESSSDDEAWEDPLVGRVWGSAVGTNVNRFALLADVSKPKSKKKQKEQAPPPSKKKKKKNKPVKPKRVLKPGEKAPMDHARDFVKHVSPQEGFSMALGYLVWGGIGGAPEGRGVLIPGGAVAFPTTVQGAQKAYKMYCPLIQLLGRTWPRFCPTLLVHLVDFVLTVEGTATDTSETVASTVLDDGSARKLYFSFSWIRLVLSQQFVLKLNPELRKEKSNNNINRDSSGTEPAPLDHLSMMGYPLNSLCDRIEEDHASSPFVLPSDNELRKTSHDILMLLKSILGETRAPNFGIQGLEWSDPNPSTTPTTVEPQIVFGPCLPPEGFMVSKASPRGDDSESTPPHVPCDDPETPNTKNGDAAKTSLEAMEALLSSSDDDDDDEDDDDDDSKNRGSRNKKGKSTIEEEDATSHDDDNDDTDDKKNSGVVLVHDTTDKPSEGMECDDEAPVVTVEAPTTPTKKQRPAWVRCTTWDPCSIGTLPGRPV